MIQRVQSVWLFLASLVLLLLLLLPILIIPHPDGEIWFQVGGLYQKTNQTLQKITSYTALFGTTILSAIICLITIFLFNNRELQKRIILLAIALIVGLTIGIGYYASQMPGGIHMATFNVAAGLPFLSILFCILAFRGIRKDEQLIRSADRLR